MTVLASSRPLALAALALAAVPGPSGPASAKDLGVRGATWPVAELDLLAEIEGRLEEMQRSGELARLQDEARARRAPETGGTGPGAEHRSGEGGTHPPVRPLHHGRTGHPHAGRRAHSRPPGPGSTRWSA